MIADGMHNSAVSTMYIFQMLVSGWLCY